MPPLPSGRVARPVQAAMGSSPRSRAPLALAQSLLLMPMTFPSAAVAAP
jgi:hypothetical protein